MEKSAPSLLVPALIGGAVSGVLSGLPLVNMLNCACCALVIGGGFLAAFLYSKECRKIDFPFRAGSGAKVGAVAGVFHGAIGAVLALLPLGPDPEEIIEQVESFGGEMPPWAINLLEAMQSAGTRFVFALVVGIIVGCIFATIGGLIGGAAFKVEPRAAGSPPPPPPQGAMTP